MQSEEHSTYHHIVVGAVAGLKVTLIDIRQEAIDAAIARLHGYRDKALARGKLAPAAAEKLLAGLAGSTDYTTIAGCDWVLEAATEDLGLKRRIFADVEARVAADAIITSNTSSLPAARIFAELRHPERATVTHFFAPAMDITRKRLFGSGNGGRDRD